MGAILRLVGTVFVLSLLLTTRGVLALVVVLQRPLPPLHPE